MEILNCNSGKIVIKMDDDFSNITVSAGGELVRDYTTFCIISRTIKQIEPEEKALTNDEKKAIVTAIANCNTLDMPVEFYGVL